MQNQLKPINSSDGQFQDGNPYTGALGTVVTSEWLNGVQSAVQSTQRELLKLLQDSKQEIDSSRDDQLLQAVRSIAWGGSSKPTTLAGYGIADGASKTDLQKAINDLVAGAPGALNTLQELAAALGNDANYAASITKQLSNKADKATTLAGYGIADGATSTQVNAAAPAGMVAYFAMKDAPAGWLIADGRPVARKDYPALFAAIGGLYGNGDGSTTFGLPNLCGEFIRGWDIGRGVDAGRAIGSAQTSSFQSHNHIVVTQEVFNPTTAFTINDNSGDGITSADNSGPGVSNLRLDRYFTQSSGGNETRPRNVALLACIKC
ncbi:hypothetical protein DK842_07665 [Chromobacterium phragmitis]|uniref:phage tail protein n=1 Tax=Chromobacterium phragmitis TaxID=2202141 RepID=UPI000DEC93A5|nr:tail fiber protein [Chromobacterium phragmitis]AXE29774.1 hypothetical protein DK842_07665 [Chromobacterium phragmitis]